MDKSRQQFEEEFMKHQILDATDIFRIDTETGDYYYLAPSQAWHWWQASRERLEVELPRKYLGEYTRNKTLNEFKKILISNGVKIKDEN